MDRKSCFFIGHREASNDLLPALAAAIETHIEDYGVGTFIVGGYGGFDLLATRVLVAAKQKHPEITLLRLISYHPAERPVKAPAGFDGTYYPFGAEKVPRRLATVKANRYVVDRVDHLIAYAWHPAGNARKLLEYARKREQRELISVCNLADRVEK